MNIIKWLKNQYLKIQESNDKILLKKYEKELFSLSNENSKLSSFNTTLVLEMEDLNKKLLDALSYKVETEITKPSWLTGKMAYKPKRRFVSRTLDMTKTFVKPQYCFDKSTLLYDLLKKNNLLNVEKTYANMKKIMLFITSKITYEYDKTENWRPITDVLMFGRGDCEDSGGIAITSALGMAGWKDDEVFLACGWMYRKGKSIDPNNKIGHAWGIAKCDGKWYVLEGTNKSAVPKLWKNLEDKYLASWGICNWKFQGMINTGKTYLEDE